MSHPWNPDLYNRALWFAAEAHGEQRVPGTRISYLLHLSQVTQEALGAVIADPSLDGDLVIACALLHDVAEDTSTSLHEITEGFGAQVAAGVSALTKRDDLPKEDAMADSLRRILEQPREVWVVKLADRITNLQRPPVHWSEDRALRYRQEAVAIRDALGEASPWLLRRLNERLETYPGDP